jgi:hypothetical protein
MLIDGELDHCKDEQQKQWTGYNQFGAPAVVVDWATRASYKQFAQRQSRTRAIGRVAETPHL